MPDPNDESVETAILTMELDAADPAALAPILAKYVVVTRGQDGCRNVDLCVSSTQAGRFVVISKWSSPEGSRRHLDSPAAVEMAAAARACSPGAPRRPARGPVGARSRVRAAGTNAILA